MGYYIDEALDDPDLKVILSVNSGGNQKLFSGLMTAPMGMSASADFGIRGTAILETAQATKDTIENFASAAPLAMLRNAASRSQDFSFRAIDLTVKFWTGTADPSFTVSFGMMNNQANRDVFGDYYDLQSMLYPELGLAGKTLIPPHGYKRSSVDSEVQGTWMVQVGRWFRADNMLLTSVSLDPSLALDQTNDKPSPIYTGVAASFTTHKTATADRVRSWYKG